MTLYRLGVILAVWLAAGAAAAAPEPPLTASERSAIVSTLSAAEDAGPQPEGSLDDAGLWAAMVRHATAESGLRVDPRDVDRLWSIAPTPRLLEAEAQAARSEGRLDAWLRSLGPAAPRYRALSAARATYARVVAAGGWGELPDLSDLKPAAVDPRVALLRARLALEGYSAAPPTTPATPATFDAGLTAALMVFQRNHGLRADGRPGPRTRAELNIPADRRLAQIDANLERWRWLPPLPDDRVEVDIGAADATLYRAGAPRLTMRTVVGDRAHRTPIFVSALDAIVFNPPWNVPASIAAQELLPKERASPGYLAGHGYSYVDGRLQQRPGPANALGRLKFDLPSPFGVYLHDTPGRSAFERVTRTLSHGCVRLEKPRELAAELLADQAWTPQGIDAAIDTGVTRRVGLRQPVPLYVLYWTAVAAADGTVEFRRDVYGWDAKLSRALGAAQAMKSP